MFDSNATRVLLASGLAAAAGVAGYVWYTRTYSPTPTRRNDKKKNILVLGLDDSGKTTLLMKLAGLPQVLRPESTGGFYTISVNVAGQTRQLLEVGGGEKYRHFWDRFAQDAAGLVYVFDASDSPRLLLAIELFQPIARVLRREQRPILVVVTKGSHPDAMPLKEVEKTLCLEKVVKPGEIVWMEKPGDQGPIDKVQHFIKMAVN